MDNSKHTIIDEHGREWPLEWTPKEGYALMCPVCGYLVEFETADMLRGVNEVKDGRVTCLRPHKDGTRHGPFFIRDLMPGGKLSK